MAKYQYETSPRKVKTNYETPKKSKKVDSNIKKKTKKKAKKKTSKAKMLFYVIVGFTMFFSITYRDAIIDAKYAEIKKLKSNLATVQKENEQLEANVEQALNLKTVQKEAEESLGMKTLSTDQIEYINLSKTDHIEASSDVEEKEENYFDKIIKFVKSLVK